MQAISVKELRQKFPFVRSELKKGTTFLIIHQSKPIAELKPLNENQIRSAYDDDDALKGLEMASLQDLNTDLGDDFLTSEEVQHYLALPPLK